MNEARGRPGRGVKFIAVLLIAGGIAGVVFGLLAQFQSLMSAHLQSTAITGVFVLLFGWSAWIGFELWRGKPRAFTWAKVIMAAQIVNFEVPGFSFDGFFTGLRVYLMISQLPPNLRFGFNISSGIHFLYSTAVNNWLFGVNLVAIVALIYLMRVTSPARAGTS